MKKLIENYHRFVSYVSKMVPTNFMNRKGKKLDEYTRALFIVDMNNGFVNFGPLANTKYQDLVDEQKRVIADFRKDNEFVGFILDNHDVKAEEFKYYPPHCVKGTEEAEPIPEHKPEQNKKDTKTYYKNCTNGMLNRTLQDDLIRMKKLKYIAIMGVLLDVCDKRFALTAVDYLQEVNKDTQVVLIKNCCDTYDAPDHNREEVIAQTIKELKAAGVIVVENLEELKEHERELVLK